MENIGRVCVLCYYHAASWSLVRVPPSGVVRQVDEVPVCQECGNALGPHFTPRIVGVLRDIMLRRLELDMVTARTRRFFARPTGKATVH